MNRSATLATAGILLAALLNLPGCTTDQDQPPSRSNVEARGSHLPDYDRGGPDEQRTNDEVRLPSRELDEPVRPLPPVERSR